MIKRWLAIVDGNIGSLWACSLGCAEAAADAQGVELGECQGADSDNFCEGGSLCPLEN